MIDIPDKDAVLALYRSTVRNMLSGNKQGVVPNASFQHASIIIEELVRCAKLRVFTFCEKLSPDVWSQPVLDQLQMAIGRNVDVQIVLSSQPALPLPAFLEGRVRFLPQDDRSRFDAIGHFTVVDGKSLRMEKDKKDRRALFAANFPEIAKELDDIFAFLRKRAS